jgi:hypothetical protein
VMGGLGATGLSPVGNMGEMCPNCHWLQNTMVPLLGKRADSRRDCCSSNKAATKTPGISKIDEQNKAVYFPMALRILAQQIRTRQDKNISRHTVSFVVTEIQLKYSALSLSPPPLVTSPPPSPPPQKQRRVPGTLAHAQALPAWIFPTRVSWRCPSTRVRCCRCASTTAGTTACPAERTEWSSSSTRTKGCS